MPSEKAVAISKYSKLKSNYHFVEFAVETLVDRNYEFHQRRRIKRNVHHQRTKTGLLHLVSIGKINTFADEKRLEIVLLGLFFFVPGAAFFFNKKKIKFKIPAWKRFGPFYTQIFIEK